MAITIREDESEVGGFALIDLGRGIEKESIRLAFRRQDADPRHLGMEGWQPEAAWLPADRVSGSRTVVRVGPAVVDYIDELVPVEILADDLGSLGVVVWPHLTRSPRQLTESRIAATPVRVNRPDRPSPPPPPPQPPPPEVEPQSRPEPGPEIAQAPAARPEPPVAVQRLEPKKKGAPKRLLAAVLVALVVAAVPFILLHMGYYELVVDVRGPLDFVENATVAGSAPGFTPASTAIAVRRAKWASWLEGWWLKDPPPAVPVIADAWLTARVGSADRGAIIFIVTPDPRAFPSGTPQLQTTVEFRNALSGISTERHSATLRRAPGRLLVDLPGGAIFRGQQGGAFAPPQVTFNLAAQGLGFRWSIEGTLPAWLELAPAQGELRDNQSVQAVAKLRPAAQALAPGTYEGQLVFKNMPSGEVTQRIARVVVDPRPEPASGKLAIDVPHPLVFTGPQGGPFAPPSVAFKLKAVGPGLKWSAEGAPAWLELAPLQGEIRDNASVDLAAKPRPSAQTLPHGTYEAQLVFRKVGPGDTLTQPVRIVVEAPTGTLKLDVPTPLVFTGPQGGPFAPQRIALNLKAVGPGLKWTVEGTPAWLELTPAAGEIRENASAEVALKPRASAQSFTPGTYEGKIAFKKIGPGAPIVQNVRLVVSITFR